MSHDLSPELTELYKSHIPAYLADIENSFKDDNLSNMKDVAHNLASAMGLIGDTISSELSRKLEKEDLSSAEIASTISELVSSVNATIATL